MALTESSDLFSAFPATEAKTTSKQMVDYKIVSRKLVRSAWNADEPPSITHLAPCDQTSIAIATTRATFLQEQLDFNALEACVALCLEDLPFLAGRMQPINSYISWKMKDLHIVNNNAGAELTDVDATSATLADCGPNTWPMQDVTISNPKVPFYIPTMDVGTKMLNGKEPVCKVQLTRLADGCILGITLSHTITDGMHWPALMTHIAARYRQVVTGKLAPTEELIASPSRPDSLSLETLQRKLPGVADWKPKPFSVKPHFCDYFRASGLLIGNAYTKMQHTILFLPKAQVAALKAAAAEGCAQPITTGDVVQALGALCVHAAEGRSLVPVRPNCMIALIQIPGADAGHFGNAVNPMDVGMDSEISNSKESKCIQDALGSLRSLAAAIRVAATQVRNNPANALQALYESQQVCDTPISNALAFLAGQRFPYVTCTTNFIGNLPSDQNLNFGGKKPLGFRSLTFPLARGMAVIRPSMPPYGEGLFLSMSLTSAQLKTLKQHPLLQTLVPEAQFLGEQSPP